MREVETRGVGSPDFTRPIELAGIPLPGKVVGPFRIVGTLPFISNHDIYHLTVIHEEDLMFFAKKIIITWLKNFLCKITISGSPPSSKLISYGNGKIEFNGILMFETNKPFSIEFERNVNIPSTISIYIEGVVINKKYLGW